MKKQVACTLTLRQKRDVIQTDTIPFPPLHKLMPATENICYAFSIATNHSGFPSLCASLIHFIPALSASTIILTKHYAV